MVFSKSLDLTRHQRTHRGETMSSCSRFRMTLSACGIHKTSKHCCTWEKHVVCSNCETYLPISTTKTNNSDDNRAFFCPDCYKTIRQLIHQNTHTVKKATKVQNTLDLAIQASDVCLEVLRLDSGKTKLEANNIQFYEFYEFLNHISSMG